MHAPEISVVIPIYNSSNFLNESLDSVLNQTFEDIEVICVNDGSTDNSLEILEEFAKKDSRIKIFSKENGGCGSARNFGLENASGNYVYFFDPDDFISANLLELSHKSAINNDSDMVIFKAYGVDGNNIINENMSFFYLDKEFNLDNYDNFTFTYKDVHNWVLNKSFAIWSKLYKKEFLDSYDDFEFESGTAFEDVTFHIKSMLRSKKISFVNEYLYHYRVDNSESLSHTAEFTFDIFNIMDLVLELLKKEGVYEEFEFDFQTFLINHGYTYVLISNSEEYLNLVKERLVKIDSKFVKHLPKFEADRYDIVMNSKDLEDFKIKNSNLPLNNLIENLRYLLDIANNEKEELLTDLDGVKNENKNLKVQLNDLNNINQILISDLEKMNKKNENLEGKLDNLNKENKNLGDKLNNLNKENKNLGEKLAKSQKLNQEILSSNSWMITKPLRKIGGIRKNLK